MSTTPGKLPEPAKAGKPLQRELLLAALALVVGLLLMPVLVWLVGRATLGDYTHGGVFAFMADYLRGLARGDLAFWIMLLGPYGFLVLGRVALRLAR